MDERAGGGLRGESVVNTPLRVGAASAPKTKLRIAAAPSLSGRARRVLDISAAAAMVVAIGAASAIFVDYLADRALARGTEAPAGPVVAKVAEPVATAEPAPKPAPALAPALAPTAAATPAPTSEPVQPMPAPIEARLPDATEIATVAAVGPEHAIEEPTDDPTASPIVHIEELGGGEEASLDETIDESADATETAAIAPDEVAPAPVAKPRTAKAKAAAEPAQRDAEVASLPGIDIGGMAGYASDEQDFSDSTVKTITKPAAKPAKAKAGGAVAAGAARVTSAVNMRSAPKKGAGVLGVVPAGSNVKVLSCDGWCQISFNGRKGWVYKSFLAAAKPQKQDAEASAGKVQSSRL